MDVNVIDSFKKDFGEFATFFKGYVKKCDKVSSRVADLIAEKDLYTNMSVEEFYVYSNVQFFKEHKEMWEKNYKNLGPFSEEFAKYVFEKEASSLDEDEKKKYSDKLNELCSENKKVAAEAAVTIAQKELEVVKTNLFEWIDKISDSVSFVMKNVSTSLDGMEAEKQAILDRKEFELSRIDMHDKDALSKHKKKFDKEFEKFNKKAEILEKISGLLRDFIEEIQDFKFRNSNVSEAFMINFEEEMDVVALISERLADLNFNNKASLKALNEYEAKLDDLVNSVRDKKSQQVIVDIVKVGEDQFSLVTRFGGKKSPSEIFTGVTLTEITIKNALDKHLRNFAIDSDTVNLDGLKAKPYVIRVNGKVIGLNDENKKGKFKYDEVAAVIGGADLGNVMSGPQPSGQGEPNPDGPQQNGQGEPNPDGPQQNGQGEPNPDGPQQNGQGEPNPDGPQQNGQGEPNPNGPQQNGQGSGANLDSSDFDRNNNPKKPETKAHKVEKVKKRNVNRALLSTLAGAGLFGVAAVGLATSPLIFIGAGAATLVGGVSGVQVILDAVRKKATMHKLKKLAQSVNGELKVYEDGSLRITSNYKGSVEPVESVDVQAIENDLGVNIQEELDRIVYANRVLKSDAPENSNKKLDFKGFEVTTPDNLERAFDEFGGLTLEDIGKISNFKYNVGRKNPFKKVGEAFTNLKDKIAERFGSDEDIDLTEEELEADKQKAAEEADKQKAAEEADKQKAAEEADKQKAAEEAAKQKAAEEERSFQGSDIGGAFDKAVSLDQNDLGFGPK